MKLDFEDAFLREVVTAEAAARGSSSRLASLVALRESDGLDADEALVDAAESMGLLGELRDQFDDLLEPLVAHDVEHVTLSDVHGGMPTCTRSDRHAEIALLSGDMRELRPVLGQLVERAVSDAEHTTVVLSLGLGGTGGCACGDDLPEDEPVGPLFER